MINMETTQKLFIITSTVLTIVVNLDAVTVNQQLCPTNKIAPHRRTTREQSSPRTLGLIYSLLGPRPLRPTFYDDDNDLQEQPQEDDPDDCGEIEDYDETDLSSVTPGAQNNLYSNREHRLLFADHKYNIPPYYPVYHYSRPERPQRPSHRPPSTQKPQRPTRVPTKPPFNSGGVFGSNVYRPPYPHYPSNHIKPVHENTYDDPQAAYKLGLIGGPLGLVIGFPPVRPTFSDEDATQEGPRNPIRFPDSRLIQKRRAGAKQTAGIIGSFVDLLFH